MTLAVARPNAAAPGASCVVPIGCAPLRRHVWSGPCAGRGGSLCERRAADDARDHLHAAERVLDVEPAGGRRCVPLAVARDRRGDPRDHGLRDAAAGQAGECRASCPTIIDQVVVPASASNAHADQVAAVGYDCLGCSGRAARSLIGAAERATYAAIADPGAARA